MPHHKHGFVCAKVGSELGTWADRREIGVVTASCAGVILHRNPDTVLGPDLAYFTELGPVDELTGWSIEPPTLAVEVVSAEERCLLLQVRVAHFLTNGVRVVWFVDYSEKRVEIYRPDRLPVHLGFDDTMTGGEELPGFTCRVGDLFRLPGDHRPTQQPPA